MDEKKRSVTREGADSEPTQAPVEPDPAEFEAPKAIETPIEPGDANAQPT